MLLALILAHEEWARFVAGALWTCVHAVHFDARVGKFARAAIAQRSEFLLCSFALCEWIGKGGTAEKCWLAQTHLLR